MQSSTQRWIWRAYLLFALLLGVIGLAAVLRQPSEAGQALMAGLSASRLVLAAGWLGLLVLLLVLLLASFWRRERFDAAASVLSERLNQPRIRGWAVLISLICWLGGMYLVLLTPEISEPFTREIFIRLLPLAAWLSALGALSLGLLAALRWPWQRQNMRLLAGFALLYLLLVGLFSLPWRWVVGRVDFTGILPVGWNEQGVPLLETQLLLAIGLGLGTAGLIGLLSRRFRLPGWAIDLGLAVAIWLLAVILWQAVPLETSWFVSEPRAPNFEFYPNSDALGYDLSAQILLAGEGYHFLTSFLSHRPMHTLYLVLLRFIGGQDYAMVVFMQILVLAFIPVCVYLLGKRISNRLAGLLAALLIVLREANSIAIAGSVTSAHVKTLMVDLPAALGVLLLVYLLVDWLQRREQKHLHPLLIGGIFGMLIYMRLELAALGLTVLLAFVVGCWKRPRWLLQAVVLFAVGAGMVLTPWLLRNARQSEVGLARFINAQMVFITWRYQENDSPTLFDPSRFIPQTGDDLPPLATPYPRQIILRQDPVPLAPQVQPTPTPAPALEQVETQREQPDGFKLSNGLQTLLTHYLNSQQQALLALPGTLRLPDSLTAFMGHRQGERLWYECCSILSYVRRLPYWHKWDGRFPQQALLPLLGSLFLIAVGLWTPRKRGFTAYVPLTAALNYLLANALVSNSGGRYILPVDWVAVLYFSIGLAWLCWRGLTAVSGRNWLGHPLAVEETAMDLPGERRILWREQWLYALLAGLLLIGCALPVLEAAIPPRYSATVQANMLAHLWAAENIPLAERQALQRLLEQPGSQVLAGRALYPRFYPGEVGEPGNFNPMRSLPVARLGFYLAGPHSLPVLVKMEQAPDAFPNASDVLVFVGPDQRAAAVAVFDKDLLFKDLLP